MDKGWEQGFWTPESGCGGWVWHDMHLLLTTNHKCVNACALYPCVAPCAVPCCGYCCVSSPRLYQKLDWLMLLAEGHLMYYGKADQVGGGGVGRERLCGKLRDRRG